jgi:acyl-CoA dehydrogenase
MDETDLGAVIDSVRRFVREQVVPLEAEIDEQDEVPTRIRQAAKDMGLFGFALPEEHGGLGLNMEQESKLVMELGYTTPSLRSMFGTNNGIAGHVLMLGGSQEQQGEWLPRIAAGETVASFALTEPEAGSDPADLTTAARFDGADWVLNGTKRYITNAPLADLFLVFARTDPDAKGAKGISCFLVPKDTPGLEIGPKDHKMGQFGAWTADVYMNDARVPATTWWAANPDYTRATRLRWDAWRTVGSTSPRSASAWPNDWSTNRSPTHATARRAASPSPHSSSCKA